MHLKTCVLLFENKCGNIYGWKSIKIRVILFKNWKHVFELPYQKEP